MSFLLCIMFEAASTDGASAWQKIRYIIIPSLVPTMVQKIECIICGDDVSCTKIMSNLQADGYHIPKDIAIASLYNTPNLNCFTLSVTTISVLAKRIGNAICNQMIHYLTGKNIRKTQKWIMRF